VCACSWRAPLTTRSSDLRIVAGQPLGDLGPSEGRPTIVAWKWYYHAGGVPIWLLIAALLVGLKENRCRQAWLIFLPVAVLEIGWRMAARLLAVSDDAAEWFGIVLMSLAMAWAAVWLRGQRLAAWPKGVRFIMALSLMVAVQLLSCLSYLGIEDTGDLFNISVASGLCSAVLLLGMALSGRSCRRGFRRGRFMGLLFLWMVVTTVVSLLLLMGVVMSRNGPDVSLVVTALIQVAIGSFFIAAALYLLNVPFMLLAFNAPFYTARFHAVFCPETPPPLPYAATEATT